MNAASKRANSHPAPLDLAAVPMPCARMKGISQPASLRNKIYRVRQLAYGQDQSILVSRCAVFMAQPPRMFAALICAVTPAIRCLVPVPMPLVRSVAATLPVQLRQTGYVSEERNPIPADAQKSADAWGALPRHRWSSFNTPMRRMTSRAISFQPSFEFSCERIQSTGIGGP